MNTALWKTCRVLANQTRLDILHRFYQGSRLCVQEVALTEKLSEPSASQQLKTLHEYGFITLERNSKWVYYQSADRPDNAIGSTLHAPLKVAVLRGKSKFGTIVRTVTAFTHPRRIDIVKTLQKKQATFDQLVWECDISAQALHRHLKKLIGRKVVEHGDDIYHLLPSDSALAGALIKCCEQTPFSHTS